MADIYKIAEELLHLTSKEVNEIAKVLKEEYGIESCRLKNKVSTVLQKEQKRVSDRAKPYAPRKIEAKGYSSKRIYRRCIKPR